MLFLTTKFRFRVARSAITEIQDRSLLLPTPLVPSDCCTPEAARGQLRIPSATYSMRSKTPEATLRKLSGVRITPSPALPLRSLKRLQLRKPVCDCDPRVPNWH